MRRVVLFLVSFFVLAPPLFLYAFRFSGAFRIELGGLDESYRRGVWSRDYEDHGPHRLRRGVRRMTYFQARMAEDGSSITVPAVVAGGDAELRLRVHRYGQPGIVRVFANGVELGSIIFREDSYPWGIRRIRLPQRFLSGGSLNLELRREETREDVDLPPGSVCAFDWIEIAPGDETARLGPNAPQWSLALAIPLLVFATLRFARAASWICEVASVLTFALIGLAHGGVSGSAAAALSRLWISFPLAAVAYLVLQRPVSGTTARRLSAAFALVLLSSSTILFWPDHLPPDVRPHLRQVERVAANGFTREGFWEISSAYGKEGRTLSLGRRHPDADYVAPYSPWSYFLVRGLRFVLDEPRFWVEFLAMVLAATLVVLAFFLARRLFEAPAGAPAACLMALEISTWHHASRAHMPALLGQVAFVSAVLYLLAHHDEMDRTGVALRFGLLSFLATLSYSATLVHFVLFIAWLAALELAQKSFARSFLVSAISGTLASVGLFYRHFLGTGPEGLTAGAAYRAPATFLFLRNQVRDTVRILEGGYPAFIVLALPAYFRLRSWSSGPFSRRVIWAWTASYVSLLILKDPRLFPEVFLQIKEDLLYAPLLAVLGGMTLTRLHSRGRKGTLAAGLVLAALLALRVNDYLYNADTIHP